MALNKETKTVLGSAADKIGNYEEAAGGGTPLPKGQKAPSKAWVQAHRKPQPRNADGTFGYNSQNGKELKYGPSRGKTVPDFLRGIDLLFLEKGTSLVMTGPNGSVEYYLSTINMTKDQLIENCKHYISSTQGFAGLHEGMMTKKKGRHSEAEKAKADEIQQNRQKNQTDDPAYQGKKVSGIVPSKTAPKLGANTMKKIGQEAMNYAGIEKALAGIDANAIGRNAWGVENYNKAGVTQQGVQDRKNWRQNIVTPANQPKPSINTGGGTPIAPAPQKQLVGVGAGAGSSPTPAPAPTSNTPKFKASNFQGKNVSSGKMGKIANLFGNIMKK